MFLVLHLDCYHTWWIWCGYFVAVVKVQFFSPSVSSVLWTVVVMLGFLILMLGFLILFNNSCCISYWNLDVQRKIFTGDQTDELPEQINCEPRSISSCSATTHESSVRLPECKMTAVRGSCPEAVGHCHECAPQLNTSENTSAVPGNYFGI